MSEQGARLQQIRERAEKATAGPWHTHGTPHPEAVRLRKEAAGVSSDECLIYLSRRDYVCLPETFERQQADAEFIANARQDVPYLLTALAASEARCRALEGVEQSLELAEAAQFAVSDDQG
jgi:hypothetical protein